MKPSRRVAGMDLSPIRLFAEGAPVDAIPLGVGEPTWDLPEPARKALNEFRGVCRYGPGSGIVPLRKTLGDYYGVAIDQVMISAGSQGALFSLLQAWVNPGETVLIPDPGFVTYRLLIQYAGAEARSYQLNESDDFRLRASSVVPLLAQEKVAAVIINCPSNPTGSGTNAEDLAEIAEECRRRDILLISDEVYRDLYLGTRPVGLRDVSEYGIVVSSVSKAWGAPGLRVGWAIGDPYWLEPARRVHAYAVTSAAYVNQLAAKALIENTAAIHVEARQYIKACWDSLAAELQRSLELTVRPPDGSFYCWLRLPDSARDDMDFCCRLRDEAKVVIVPGSIFGPAGGGYARVSFAATPPQIAEGIRRIGDYLRKDHDS